MKFLEQIVFISIFFLAFLISEAVSNPFLVGRNESTFRSISRVRPTPTPAPVRGNCGGRFNPCPQPPAPPPRVRPGHPSSGRERVAPVRPRPSDPRRVVRQPVVRRNDPVDRDAHSIIDQELSAGDKCENLGQLLVRVSNRMIRMAQIIKKYNGVRPNGILERIQFDIAERNLRRRDFMERVWERLADVYRQCDVDCFDSGAAIGQMSGLGYCSVSVGLGGLDSIGFSITPPLPMCERSVNIACQSGYREAVQSFQGCELYAESGYSDIFREYMSQDCQVN